MTMKRKIKIGDVCWYKYFSNIDGCEYELVCYVEKMHGGTITLVDQTGKRHYRTVNSLPMIEFDGRLKWL